MEFLGFFLNNQMKWTFKSHKGFFVPVIYNNRIKGLRIHLEEEYKLETTDIWFSSSKEYRGANAKNWMLNLIPNNETNLEIVDNHREERDVIIASEMLIAYKAYSEYNKITIGLPNTISKKQAREILENIPIKRATILFDKHTMFTDPFLIYKHLLNKMDETKTDIKMIFNDAEIANIKNETIIKAA